VAPDENAHRGQLADSEWRVDDKELFQRSGEATTSVLCCTAVSGVAEDPKFYPKKSRSLAILHATRISAAST